MGSAGDVIFGSEKWINVLTDPFASLNSLSQCMVLADLNADDDTKFVVADFGDILQSFSCTGQQSHGVKLKVYRGTSVASEITITDLPTAMVAIHIDALIPNVPVLAIGSGSSIYIFKNLRPYFKFAFPSLEIDKVEMQAWINFKNGSLTCLKLLEVLDNMRGEGKLSLMMQRSLQFLEIPTMEERESFAVSIKDAPLIRSTSITCMTSLKKSSPEDGSISCLVIGLEHSQISIINPETFSILVSYSLESVPVFLNAQGLYDVEYTVLVACRDGAVYGIKRDIKKPREFFRLTSHIVGMLRIGKSIVVGCMDETMMAYNMKGKMLWSVKVPNSIICMELLDVKMKNLQAILVATKSSRAASSNDSRHGEVLVYMEKNLVDVIKTEDEVLAMTFGKYGRESDALVMVTQSGGLLVKMLKRTAQFDEKGISYVDPKALQKLDIPKKTKLFLDQLAREKESCVEIYQQFQEDLCKLKLEAARRFVDVLDKNLISVSVDQETPVKLNVEVNGLGPRFKMNLIVQNTSMTNICTDLFITFEWDDTFYDIENMLIELPMLVPGITYTFPTFIKCLSDRALSNTIKVFLCKTNGPPVLTAIVDMPASEGNLLL